MKYCVFENSSTIKDRAAITEGCTLDPSGYEPRKLAGPCSLDDALECLHNEYPKTIIQSAGQGFFVTEFYVTEVDEDGEAISAGDIWLSKIPEEEA